MTDATQQDAVRDAIMEERVTRHHALLTFCRELFTDNIIGSDIDDVQVFEVTGRRFPQQPDGGGGTRHLLGVLAHDRQDERGVPSRPEAASTR